MSETFRKPKDHYTVIGTVTGPDNETIELIDRKAYDALKAENERLTYALKEIARDSLGARQIAVEVLGLDQPSD